MIVLYAHKIKGMSQLELEDEVQDDLKRATGEFTKDGSYLYKYFVYIMYMASIFCFAIPEFD